MQIRHANDGTRDGPRLEVHQAMWSMKRYGNDGTEWSIERKFEEMAKAGFTGIFGSLPEPGDESRWRRLMEEHRFSFGLETFPTNRHDLREALKRAQDYHVLYINAQVKDSFTIGDQAIELIKELYDEAACYQVPFFVETHRGRITQDLIRTVNYVRSVPELTLTIDFSHYVLAGEMYDFGQANRYFDQLLKRTGSIHARVTNGQQIQIDIGDDAEHPMVKPFLGWWKTGMREWLTRAQPGDVLPFICEIGHHYAVTPNFLPSVHSDDEYSDRWQQSKLFKRLAEQIWREIQTEGKSHE